MCKRRRGLSGGRLHRPRWKNDGGAVDPHLLEAAGTDLVRSGRFLGRLTVGPTGRVRILRACCGAECHLRKRRPRFVGLLVTAKTGHPRRAPFAPRPAEVINVRINSDSRRPWEGIAPLEPSAAASGELAARLAS